MTEPPGSAGASYEPQPFGLRILGRPDEPARITTFRVQVLLSVLIVTSNLVGVAVVYVLAAFVVPGPTPRDPARLAVVNLLLGLAYTAVFTAVALEFLGASGKSGSARYAIINSLGNLPVAYMSWLDGRGYAHGGPRAMPGIDAAVTTGVGVLLLAHFLLSRTHRKAAQPAPHGS